MLDINKIRGSYAIPPKGWLDQLCHSMKRQCDGDMLWVNNNIIMLKESESHIMLNYYDIWLPIKLYVFNFSETQKYIETILKNKFSVKKYVYPMRNTENVIYKK